MTIPRPPTCRGDAAPDAGSSLTLITADGERLAAVHMPTPDQRRSLGLVLAHGFSGSIARPAVGAVAAGLARHAGVVAFDFRGHGRSTGRSTLGAREVLDVDAAVLTARRLGYRRVVSCGWSMGAATVLRHAALHGGVDAVVAVSGTSRWFYRGTVPMRRLHWVVQRRLGRLVARRLLGTRVGTDGWDPLPESPVDVVARIAPTPLLIVHGDRDRYFPLHHPLELAAAAGQPSELWIVEGFGHAEAAADPDLLDRIGAALPALVERRP